MIIKKMDSKEKEIAELEALLKTRLPPPAAVRDGEGIEARKQTAEGRIQKPDARGQRAEGRGQAANGNGDDSLTEFFSQISSGP